MSHFIYVLYSQSRDRFYIGSCADVEQRLIRHNAGATISTKSGRPWKIVYTETYPTKTEALKTRNQSEENEKPRVSRRNDHRISQPIVSAIFQT